MTVDIQAVANMIQGTSLVATPSKSPMQGRTIPNGLRMYRFEVTALASRISPNVKTEGERSVPETSPEELLAGRLLYEIALLNTQT